jgi:class 3 adenylate cyclase/tetratricopeptide (TPR) repeat protein
MQTCRSCGERNPDRARFCMMCATPLRVGQVGETRKVVTILFADVKGSTAIGERLDPEAVRRVLSTFYASARDALERHGGTVEKFIGDAVMAVFGVPRVHEDDAARGVRAAWALLDVMAAMNAELSERYGAELQLRIGVNTGEVVAGDPGTGSSFVAGDAVNVAARLEQTADPGTIYLGAETYELARDIAEVEPVEPLTLKGKSQPVPAFRLTGLRARDEPAASDVPFVGRQAELAKLDGIIEATAAGAARSVALHGPAGIGKTALIEEVVRRLVGRARVVRCRCIPEGEQAALEPVRQLLVSALGLGRDATRGELIDQSRAILGGGDRFELVEATLQRLVDETDTSDAAWLLAEVLRGLGERDPTVVAVDDAHHASPAIADLLADVRRRISDLPVLWLEAYRTDQVNAGTPAPADATAVALSPLEPTEARMLLQAAGPDLPRAVVAKILEAAEGNPLFLLETARLVAERGHAEVRIPSGIRALLAARLDSLFDTERRVLEVAAIFGRTASRDRLEELLGEEAARLDQLVGEGFLRATVDLVGFKHGALRDVAYAGATKQRRAELHEAIADLSERDDEPVEVIAHHLDLSAGLRSELGAPDEHDRELSSRAAVALAASGRMALGRRDRETALATLSRAATRALVAAEEGRARTAVGRLAFELGAWDEVTAMLNPVEDDPSAWNPLGVALVKRRRDADLDRGRTLLAKAAAAGDVDAAAALAGSWKTVDDQRAYELYLAALDLDPTDPYALGNVLEVEIRRSGDLVPVADRRPALASALLRRRAQALEGDDLPWSFFDLGKFELFLGEDEEAVASFASAVASSSAAYMLETSARSLESVRAACETMDGYGWSLDLLELGIRAQFGEAARPDEPVWILVGGSSAQGTGRIAAYREALMGALDGAKGLLISGGTAQGVSALAADVSAAHDGIRSIGYLPSTLPKDVDADERYDELRRTSGDRFSPLEPVTYWRDLLDQGFPTADVSMVAVGGGRLTTLEIQIALALGGRVAVIAGSGGAAGSVMHNRTWATAARLSQVEPTTDALRSFLLPDLE